MLKTTKLRMLKPTKLSMLKPIKLQDFDDGQAFLPHYDHSTSVEDFGYFCVFFRTIVKSLEHTQVPNIVDLPS